MWTTDSNIDGDVLTKSFGVNVCFRLFIDFTALGVVFLSSLLPIF